MYDENGFAEQGNSEIYTECKVVEPQDHKKKKSGKRIVKWTAGILCAAMLVGGGYAAGSAFGTNAGNKSGIGASSNLVAGVAGNPADGGNVQAEPDYGGGREQFGQDSLYPGADCRKMPFLGGGNHREIKAGSLQYVRSDKGI